MAGLRAAYPAIDTTTVVARVWRDGPPWFSCAEVRAKLRRQVDEPAVRDTLGNWAPLVRSGWAAMRDTAAGPVTDPGWCVLAIADSASSRVATWQRVLGDSLPSGGRRRGWIFVAGRRQLVVLERPQRAGRDSATVEFGIVVVANEHGQAAGADRDTIRLRGLLSRGGDAWRLVSVRPSSAAD